MSKWWQRHNVRTVEDESVSSPLPNIKKFGESLTPNMRALRLAVTASDALLSMGVSTNSVVTKALDITDTYCSQPVHIDISSNLIMLSQIRGTDKEPLTLIRPVTLRGINYRTIQDIQKLIYDITQGDYTLREAEKKLEEILKNPTAYPWWVVMIGNAGIAAGVSLMFTSAWRIVLVTFIIGLLVDRLLATLIKRALPPFFRQVAAACFVTLSAAVIALLGREGVTFFQGMNPTLIVVGGIIMLVAGLAIVSAIQDAIEEYYLTATARILKVCMLTVGIVIGILIGLYTARKLGFGIAVSPDPLSLNAWRFLLIGGGVASAAYALATHTHWRAIILTGLIGSGSLLVSSWARGLDIAVTPASGVAAVAVGLTASLLSRWGRTPSVGLIAAAIIPLVPGLALYNGLMQLVNYPPGDPLFARGLGTLFTAVATALAIAAGASFGSMASRPVRQKITHSRNLAPFMGYMRNQLKRGSRLSIASLALTSYIDPEHKKHKQPDSDTEPSNED